MSAPLVAGHVSGDPVEAVGYDRDLADRSGCKRAFDAGRSGRPSPAAARTYADEPFSWALLGPGEPVQRSVIPKQVVLGRCEMATRIGAFLVGTVNNTATEDTAAVTASASAPLAVSPQATTLTVPPYAGRGVALRLAAPRDSTPGGYDVHVQSVTFAPVPARYVRLEATAASGGSYASAAEVSAR